MATVGVAGVVVIPVVKEVIGEVVVVGGVAVEEIIREAEEINVI